MKKNAQKESFLELRAVGIALSIIMYITNFFLVYFICFLSFPDLTGLWRVIWCWVAAYVLTRIMIYLAKGVWRLALAIFLLGALYFVLTFNP